MESPTAQQSRRPGSLRGKLAIVGATGLFIGAAVAGVSGIASADEPDVTVGAAAAVGERSGLGEQRDVEVEVHADEGGVAWDVELSPDDEALLAEFEECLTDAGLDEAALDAKAEAGELTDEDHETIERAFEGCEPILDDLSEGGGIVFEEEVLHEGDLSPEDEAVFEEFEACLIEAGLDEEALVAEEEAGELTDEDYEIIERAFEGCERILDDLSEDAAILLEGCDDEEILHDGGEYHGDGLFEDGDGHDKADHDEADHDEADHDEADHDEDSDEHVEDGRDQDDRDGEAADA